MKKSKVYYIYIANIWWLKEFEKNEIKVFIVKNRTVEEIKKRLFEYKDKFIYLRNNIVRIEVKEGTDIKKIEEKLNKVKNNKSTLQIVDAINTLDKKYKENIISVKIIKDMLVLDYDLEDSYIDYKEILDIVDKMIFLKWKVWKARIVVSKNEERYKNMQIQFKYLDTISEYEKIVVENKIKKNFIFDKALLDREQYYLFMYKKWYNRIYERKILNEEMKKKILELEEEIRRKNNRLLTMLFYNFFNVIKEGKKIKIWLRFSNFYKEYEKEFKFKWKKYKSWLAVYINKKYKEIKKKEGEYIYNIITEKRIEYIKQIINFFNILEKKYNKIFDYKKIYENIIDLNKKNKKISNIVITKESLIKILENIEKIDLNELYKYLIINFKRNNIYIEWKERIKDKEDIINEIKKIKFDYIILFCNSVENIFFKVTKNFAKIYNAIYKYIEENNIEYYKTIFTTKNISEEYINNNLYIIIRNIIKKWKVKYFSLVNKDNKKIIENIIKEFKKHWLKTLKEFEEEEKKIINSDKYNFWKLIKKIYEAGKKERKKIREENKEFLDKVVGIEKTKKHYLERLVNLEKKKVIIKETVVSKWKEVEIVDTIIYNTYRKLAEKNKQKNIIKNKEEFIKELWKKDFVNYFKSFIIENDVKLLVRRIGLTKYLKKVDYISFIHFIQKNKNYSYLNKFINSYSDFDKENNKLKIKKSMFYILYSTLWRSLLKEIIKFLEDKGFLEKKERKEKIKKIDWINWEVYNIKRYIQENYYIWNRYNCLVKVTWYIEQRWLYNDNEVLEIYKQILDDYDSHHRQNFRFLNVNRF